MNKCLTLVHLTACWIRESPNGPGNLQGVVSGGLQALFMLSVYRRSGVFVTMSRAIGQSIPAPGGLISGRVNDRPAPRWKNVCGSRGRSLLISWNVAPR